MKKFNSKKRDKEQEILAEANAWETGSRGTQSTPKVMMAEASCTT